jgi:small-conductance mechanosensitive channel
VFLDDNQAIERQIVNLSLECAKADAALEASAAFSQGKAARSDPSPPDLAHFIELRNRNEQLRQQAVQEIQDLGSRRNKPRDADHSKLKELKEGAQTRLQVLDAVGQGLNELVDFVQNSAEGQARKGHLESTIDDLAQSIPEVIGPPVLSATVPQQETNSRMPGKDTGILGLVSDVSATRRKLHVVDEKMRLTDELKLSANNLRIPLARFITHLIQSVAISNSQSSDLISLQKQKAHLDAVTLDLKELSPVIVALDKQKILLAEYDSRVAAWRTAVAGQYKQACKQLTMRLIAVSSIILVLVAIGQLSRRFAVRHVQDPNRRRFITMSHQFLTLFIVTAFIVFVFASDLRSLATYFGLLGAGLLLALEQVILATLGSLLLVGKRGIRIGDRVQISGVTGDVIDMGLLQFQLQEFDVLNRRFTGRVATFSNSMVFVSPAIGLVRFNSAPEEVPPGSSD